MVIANELYFRLGSFTLARTVKVYLSVCKNVLFAPILLLNVYRKGVPLNTKLSSNSADNLALMPDIANDVRAKVAGTLDWVGMNEIEIPIRVETATGEIIHCPARITAFVNLIEPNVQGIHMSRLYLHLDELLAKETLNPVTLKKLVQLFLDSHIGLSDRAMVRIDFDYMVRRPALISDNSGWRRYPVSVIGDLQKDRFCMQMALQVLYSSTCPCSAALARQLIQQQFDKDFGGQSSVSNEDVRQWLGSDQGIIATPHSQRSALDVRVRLAEGLGAFPLLDLIDLSEQAFQTPVQTAVKREDEQAFARLNGGNLMFCEDAGRRIKQALDNASQISDYWARCQHFESLHPHNAVSVVTKGVPGGFQPIDSCHRQ